MDKYSKPPILFLTFNRFDTTKKVFQAIREFAPKKLYVASDGPRTGVSREDLKVNEVRDFIQSNVDWECEVKTLFRENNLGCKIAVSSAIDWFFEHENMGIILEDDCLPSQSFFRFCEELLIKYENNERIALISGDNFSKKKIGEADYYFSKISRIWGWATWRRAWEKYDVSMARFPEFKKSGEMKKIWSDRKVQSYWLYILNEVYNNKIDTWDHQLTFTLFLNDSFCICPNVNLVSNIGFGKDFTNTVLNDDRVTNLELGEIYSPLVHSQKIEYSEKNNNCDNDIALKNYKIKIFLKKIGIFNKVKRAYIWLRSYKLFI